MRHGKRGAPARRTPSMNGLDSCGLDAGEGVAAAAERHSVLPSCESWRIPLSTTEQTSCGKPAQALDVVPFAWVLVVPAMGGQPDCGTTLSAERIDCTLVRWAASASSLQLLDWRSSRRSKIALPMRVAASEASAPPSE
eukprot:scaffold278527_cov26-Tisochrysis_lutea.AAC.2